MKKIYQFVKGSIKLVLSNVDYILAFFAGAVAYKFYPTLLEDVYNALMTFDYAGAWMSTKMFAVDAYMWIKGAAIDLVALFKDKEEMTA